MHAGRSSLVSHRRHRHRLSRLSPTHQGHVHLRRQCSPPCPRGQLCKALRRTCIPRTRPSRRSRSITSRHRRTRRSAQPRASLQCGPSVQPLVNLHCAPSKLQRCHRIRRMRRLASHHKEWLATTCHRCIPWGPTYRASRLPHQHCDHRSDKCSHTVLLAPRQLSSICSRGVPFLVCNAQLCRRRSQGCQDLLCPCRSWRHREWCHPGCRSLRPGSHSLRSRTLPAGQVPLSHPWWARPTKATLRLISTPRSRCSLRHHLRGRFRILLKQHSPLRQRMR